MCFDSDSLPPIPVISGAAVSHDDLVLEAADGSRFAAFAAAPDEPASSGVVDPPRRPRALPLLRGARASLRRARHRRRRVRLFRPDRRRGEARRRLRVHGAREADDAGDRAGRRRRLRRVPSGPRRAAPSSPSASASAGGTRGSRPRPGTGSRAPSASTGGRRSRTHRACKGRSSRCRPERTRTSPHEDNAAFDAALTDAGVEHELVEYDGAPHSFFDRKQEEFQDASDDAWRRTLELIAAHAK